MKKILTIATSLAIVAGFTSCQKENVIETEGDGVNTQTLSITATFAKPTTKVTYSEKENSDLLPEWQENDIIVGITSGNEVFEFYVASVNESGVATLQHQSGGGDMPSGKVTLFYCAGLRSSNWDSTNKQFVVDFNNQKGDKDMPAIMCAKGTITNGAEFTFDNKGAVLGIYEVGVNLKEKTIKQVTLYGKNLASSAILEYSGVTSESPNNGFNVISTKVFSNIIVGKDEKGGLSSPILMAIPAGAEINSVFIRTADGEVYSLGSSNSNALAANDYRYIKGVTFERDADRDDMILTGVFSVQNGEGQPVKQVFFSKGNLWADANKALHFESDQSSFARNDGHVPYFTWSSTIENAVSENNSGEFFFCNEENKQSVNGSTKIYYALSSAEWQYLFKNHSKKASKVNNKEGVVLAPVGFTGTISGQYANDAELADYNLVFLPAEGHGVMSINTGYYWSSTPAGKYNAYGLSLTSNNFILDYSSFRDSRFSVRLVANCE